MTGVAHAPVVPQVLIDGEPTPLVASLARTLRESARHPDLAVLIDTTTATVGLRLSDGQAATLRFVDGGVHLAHGTVDGFDTIGLAAEPEYTPEDASGPLGEALLRLLHPPLPHWRDAATSFWAVNQGTPGFPRQLRVVCTDDAEEMALGEGADVYEIHGSSHALAEVFSGRGESFLMVLASGAITVVGGVGQLSVMCGAHWKVRFGG